MNLRNKTTLEFRTVFGSPLGVPNFQVSLYPYSPLQNSICKYNRKDVLHVFFHIYLCNNSYYIYTNKMPNLRWKKSPGSLIVLLVVDTPVGSLEPNSVGHGIAFCNAAFVD